MNCLEFGNKLSEILRSSKKEGTDEIDNSLLLFEAISVHVTLVEFLLFNFKEINLNIQNKNGDTPLMYAIKLKRYSVARLLINNKRVNVNIQNKKGWTALHLIAYDGCYFLLNDLLKEVDNIDIENNKGDTPLSLTISIKTLKILIKYGANVNSQNKQGATLLSDAITSNELRLAHYLINRKDVDINLRLLPKDPNGGADALIVAAIFGHLGIIKHLLRRGADINTKDNKGINILLIAVYKGHLNVVKYLIEEQKMDVNIVDNKGNNILMNAVDDGYLDIVKYLVEEQKMNVNIVNKFNSTLLLIAMAKNKDDVAAYLIEKGVDVNIENLFEENTISCALRNDNKPLAEFLLSKGAVVKSKRLDSDTECLISKDPIEQSEYYMMCHNNHILSLSSYHSLTGMHKSVCCYCKHAIKYAVIKNL